MRIATANLIVLLVCSCGGFVSGAAVWSQYRALETANTAVYEAQLAQRDLNQFEVVMNQWFVGLDLFFDAGESYVANTVTRQVADMSELLVSISALTGRDFSLWTSDLQKVAAQVEDLSLSGPADAPRWNQGIQQIDQRTAGIVERYELLVGEQAAVITRLEGASQAAVGRLSVVTTLAVCLYLVSIFVAWFWANRQIVRPIRRLDEQAAIDPDVADQEFLLDAAPLEIKQLSTTLADFVSKLNERNRVVSTQRSALQAQLEEIQRTRDQLIKAEKLASVGQLAAGVAHEINNPMSFVSGNLATLSDYTRGIADYARQLHRYVSNQQPHGEAEVELNAQMIGLWEELDMTFVLEDLNDLLADSKDGARRITRIVSDLSSFTEASTAVSEVDLAELIQQTLDTMAEKWPQVEQIQTKLPHGIRCELAHVRVAQCIDALVENALEAIAETEGGVEVVCGSDRREVWLEVRDTGCGIPEDQINKVFDPFYTTKPVGKGVGLSLHFVQSMVDQHNADLQMSSTPGEGTTVRISFPLVVEQLVA